MDTIFNGGIIDMHLAHPTHIVGGRPDQTVKPGDIQQQQGTSINGACGWIDWMSRLTRTSSYTSTLDI